MSTVQELSCADFSELVGDYLEGARDAAWRDSFELHEVGCVGCAEYHRQLRVTRELIAGERRRWVAEPASGSAPAGAPGERVAAFKFLCSGAVGPFSGFRWPAGEWVRAAEPLAACVSAVHACNKEQLPYWLNDELWRVELGGPVQEHEHKLAGASGRLVEQVTRWDESTARRFAETCAEEVDRLVQDLEPDSREECEEVRDLFLSYPPFAAAPATAALAAYLSGRTPDSEAAQANERARQASWLVDELGLDSA